MKIKDFINDRRITRFRIVRPDKSFIDFTNPCHMGFMPASAPLSDTDLNLTIAYITRLDDDDNNIYLIGDADRDDLPPYMLYDALSDPHYIMFTV